MSAHLVLPQKATRYESSNADVGCGADAIPVRRETVSISGLLGSIVVAVVLASGVYFIFAYLW
jgi:hypothetical protein